MSENQAGTAAVLRRLITREGVPGGIPVMTPLRALRLAISRAGQIVHVARLRLVAFEDRRATIPEIADATHSGSMVLRMIGPNGARGLMILEEALVQAIVVARMTGNLPEAGAPTRHTTRVDSVVAQALLAAILKEFTDAAEGLDIGPLLSGFRLGDFISDRDGTFLNWPEIPQRVFDASVAWGDEGGPARLQIIVPAKATGPQGIPSQRMAPMDWQDLLTRHVQAADAQVSAQFQPVSVSLKALHALEVGSLLALPEGALNAIRIMGIDGEVVATGKLGQMRGNRAVRISFQD